MLTEFVENTIWVKCYPVHYFGIDLEARMSVVRLPGGELLLHSPGPMDDLTLKELSLIGSVSYIVAPGSYHYLHVKDAQRAFPDAKTYICPGIERKQPQLSFNSFLSDNTPAEWYGVFDQVLIRGARYMWEVVFLHRPTKTLLVVDLIEDIFDKTPGVDWKLKFWWKVVFQMWNKPMPAPEYQLGWEDRYAARQSLETILAWDFDKIVLSHGDLITTGAKSAARAAFSSVLD